MQPARTVQFGFGAALAILFVVGIVAYRSVIASNESARWTQHTYEVLEHIAGLRAAIDNTDSGYRDFAMGRDEALLEPARANIARLHKELATLRALTSDNAGQQRRIVTLAGLAQQNSLPEAFHAALGDMEDEEHRLLLERGADQQRRIRQVKAVVVLAGAAGLLMVALAGWMVQLNLVARKRAELAFRDGEERYRLLIEGVQDYSICMLDPEGVVVSWNAGAERIKGYKTAEIIGQHFSRFYPQAIVDLGGPQEDLKIAAATGRCEAEQWRIRKDGSRFWANIVITAARNSSNTLLGFSKITRDITERKETEARYRALLEAAPDAMVVIDQGGAIVLLNTQVENQFGFTREQLLGQPIELLVPVRFRNVHPGHRRGFFADPRVRTMGIGLDLYGLRKDGSEFPVEVMLSPLTSAEGTLVTAAIRDISVRKIAEEHLIQMAGELKRSNDELSQFAHVASHDLQEPLRMVTSYTQLLAKRYQGRLEGDADEFIAHAVGGCHRMQQLIRDLLAYSSAGIGGKAPRKISSESALQQALNVLQTTIEESGAVVTHDSLPAITTDDTQLCQVFQNLVGNAIKYRCAEVPRIHVSAATHGGKEWIFSVRDNGLGIDPQHFDRIFVLFQRLHGREEFTGTGIGLAICKKILERLGGRIWVESQIKQGSTFHFALPAGVAN